MLRRIGVWKKLGTKTASVFINADDKGCVVQQIYYSAPLALFEKFLEEIAAAIDSAEWA